MLNRRETSVVRSLRQSEYLSLIVATGATRKGTVYHPVHKTIVGYNFGTSVRPNVAPIALTSNGSESVESFLARGGQIHRGAPKVAKGAVIVDQVKSNPTRVRTSRG